MARCLISLGANLGDPQSSVLAAVDRLQQALESGDTVSLSNLYETPPVGGPSGQATFVNAVAAIQTQLSVWQVWEIIKSIEHALGRQRIERWEARRIDMDILLYDQQRIWTPQLKVPHPRMCMRRFILQPAAQVAPDWIDPVTTWTIQQLSDSLQSGPGNLLLVADRQLNPDKILSDIGCSTGSRQIDALALLSGRTGNCDRRSVGWIDMEKFLDWTQSTQDRPATTSFIDPKSPIQCLDEKGHAMSARLLFFWMPASPDQAWEQRYIQLAQQLGLAETCPSEGLPRLPRLGPRYLMSSSDTQWVSHELSAALQAMDCLIQPLS